MGKAGKKEKDDCHLATGKRGGGQKLEEKNRAQYWIGSGNIRRWGKRLGPSEGTV